MKNLVNSNVRKGNVLVIGNSGVGKSTLINAVLGDDKAETGWGTKGTTDSLKVYDNKNVPFRIIDTIGFEPNFIKRQKAINAVKKWSKNCAAEGHSDNQINVIWFCIDGTSRKLFPEAINSLSQATAMWPSVPVIVVITKSYSQPEREENIQMVHNAFARRKRFSKNLVAVIPVVAQSYFLDETVFAPPVGISELFDKTDEIMPSGLKAAEKDIATFKLNRKRALAQGIVASSIAVGAVVGAVPIPFPDAAILGPAEVAEVNAISRIYEIGKDEKSKQLLNSIVQAGTVGTGAKLAINALKAVPGIQLGAAAINSIIAGSIIAALGEGSIYAFEQVYLGNKSVDDVDWVKQIIESKLSTDFISKVSEALKSSTGKIDKNAIIKMVSSLFVNDNKKK